MQSQPLIATTKGNIPMAGLRHETLWKITPDNILFKEMYFLGDEMVKESSHLCVLTGAASVGEASI